MGNFHVGRDRLRRVPRCESSSCTRSLPRCSASSSGTPMKNRTLTWCGVVLAGAERRREAVLTTSAGADRRQHGLTVDASPADRVCTRTTSVARTLGRRRGTLEYPERREMHLLAVYGGADVQQLHPPVTTAAAAVRSRLRPGRRCRVRRSIPRNPAGDAADLVAQAVTERGRQDSDFRPAARRPDRWAEPRRSRPRAAEIAAPGLAGGRAGQWTEYLPPDAEDSARSLFLREGDLFLETSALALIVSPRTFVTF